MVLKHVMKALSDEGIHTVIEYDKGRGKFYLDLQTLAKSDLHLYEDGTIRGRYGYENQVNLEQPVESLTVDLCYEFTRAMHGRDFGQQSWFDLCRAKNVKLHFN